MQRGLTENFSESNSSNSLVLHINEAAGSGARQQAVPCSSSVASNQNRRRNTTTNVNAHTNTTTNKTSLRQLKSQVSVNMDALLGELSEIRAEHGLQGDGTGGLLLDQASKEISSEVCFNVLEGHSSVAGDNDTEGERVIVGVAQEESEVAYESLIEKLIEEQDSNTITLVTAD